MTTSTSSDSQPNKNQRKCMPVDPENRVFPKAPDLSTVDPVLDAMAFYEARDEAVREYYVYLMTTEIIQEKLSMCNFLEGVNQHEKCRALREAYYRRLPGGSEYREFDFRDVVREAKLKREARVAANATSNE